MLGPGWGASTKEQVGEVRLEMKDLWDPQEMGTGGRKGCHRCSAVELGLDLGKQIEKVSR